MELGMYAPRASAFRIADVPTLVLASESLECACASAIAPVVPLFNSAPERSIGTMVAPSSALSPGEISGNSATASRLQLITCFPPKPLAHERVEP